MKVDQKIAIGWPTFLRDYAQTQLMQLSCEGRRCMAICARNSKLELKLELKLRVHPRC
jgi:hypothetical protein